MTCGVESTSRLPTEVDLKTQLASHVPFLLALRFEKMLENAGVQRKNLVTSAGDTENVSILFAISVHKRSENNESNCVKNVA